MKIEVYHEYNKFPGLMITAENKAEKLQLKLLLKDLHLAQLKGLSTLHTGRFNVCGSEEDDEGVISLYLDLILGGYALGVLWYPDCSNGREVNIKQKEHAIKIIAKMDEIEAENERTRELLSSEDSGG
jgi:hypothetical protein